jgi:two-component system, LytTR family, sensor kinase
MSNVAFKSIEKNDTIICVHNEERNIPILNFRDKYLSTIQPLGFLREPSLYQSKEDRTLEIEKENRYLIRQLEDSAKRIKQLENDFLRTQISPHFVYNTLSSVYTKISKQVPEVAEQIMLLSEIMSYATQKTTYDDEVFLEEELETIVRYLELQNRRFDMNGGFTYQQSGNPDGAKILPLILLTFIENAFKYGDRSDENCQIEIIVNISDDSLFFSCKNKIYSNTQPSCKSMGIGLLNLKKRLGLNYPDSHELTINQTDKSFEVAFMLEL